MREIDVGEIIKAVEELCIKANKILPDDLCGCISCAEKSETDELPKKIMGTLLENAVNEGVSRGYTNGLLRKSIVRDPLDRVNTNDNTPAVIHTRIVPGDKIKLTVAPKGFGSENMSRLKMFTPSASKDDLMDFVLETVKLAGGNPCPPMVIGVGFGGDFEYCAYLAKKALCRDEYRPSGLRRQNHGSCRKH